MPATRSGVRTRWLMRVTFGVIVALLAITQVVAYLQWDGAMASVDAIERNAFASLRLVNRMGLDVQRVRILIDRHIFEKSARSMQLLEDQIAATRADYAAAAVAYAPLATFPGEPEAWQQLTRDVVSSEQQSARPLELSRANRDDEAYQAMLAIEPTFDAVEADVSRLVAVNSTAATGAREHVESLLTGVLLLRSILGIALIAVTFVAGTWLTRRIERSELRQRAQANELETRNRELDAFAGRVAHDLRGPLNTVSLATSMLAERAPAEQATTTILRRGVAQMSLVEDLLGLARLGAPPPGAVARIGPLAESVAKDIVTGRGGRERHAAAGHRVRDAALQRWPPAPGAVEPRRERGEVSPPRCPAGDRGRRPRDRRRLLAHGLRQRRGHDAR